MAVKKAKKSKAARPAKRSSFSSELMSSNPNSYVVQFGIVFIIVAALALAYYAGWMRHM